MTFARYAATLTGLLLAAACSQPAVDITAETAALRARSEGVSTAEAAKDRAKALTFYVPDAVVQPAGMPQLQGQEAIGHMYQVFFDSSGIKSFEGKSSGFVVAAAGDLAYETGVNRMVFATPKGDVLDVGKYLAVWKKSNGTWLIAALSFTSDAPAPTPVPAAK